MLRDTLRDEVEKEYTYFYGYQPDQSVVYALDNMTDVELQDELDTLQYQQSIASFNGGCTDEH